MKALFLIFHGFAPHNGISKKIRYQVDALQRCGVDTELCYTHIDAAGGQFRMVDDKVVDDFGSGVVAKIKKRVSYEKITRYVVDNEYDFVYVRSAHNANPFLIKMFNKLHKHGVKIAVEIPTYPYEAQFKGTSLQMRSMLWVDIVFRKSLYALTDKIISFTDNKTIFGTPNIEISNGIDFSKIEVKSSKRDTSEEVRFIAVAELHFWHGFDRMIRGIAQYKGHRRVMLNIVGDGFGGEKQQLASLAKELGVDDRVVFHGNLAGDELTKVFMESDFAVASLARHRSGITKIKTLKNREYAARGVPFVYSEIDDDFESMPYIIKAPADESAIDVERLVEFYDSLTLSPQQIRSSIEGTLSWDVQMKKVVENLMK